MYRGHASTVIRDANGKRVFTERWSTKAPVKSSSDAWAGTLHAHTQPAKREVPTLTQQPQLERVRSVHEAAAINTGFDELVVYATDSHNHHLYLLEVRFTNVVVEGMQDIDTIKQRLQQTLSEYASGSLIKVGIRGHPHNTTMPAQKVIRGTLVKLTASQQKEWHSETVTVTL